MPTHNVAPTETDISALRGLVATVNLTGTIEAATHDAIFQLGMWNAAHGFQNVEYLTFPAQLVESGRDAVCAHALQHSYDWVLMVDGDATFPADTLARMLHTSFVTHPDADVVGAYSQLKGSYLPTIDTGSGTWEPHFPGEGVLPVIRTGGHCLLIKTPILRQFGPPWFRTREALLPTRILAEMDNFARITLHGRNPLADTEAWQKLVEAARGGKGGGSVGEDSGFCDAVRAVGGQIYVDTSIVTGHIERHTISPADLKRSLDSQKARLAAAVGVELD